MIYFVTGVAGFIGANLVELLLEKGETVIGIDNFSEYYPRKVKEHNLNSIPKNPNFTFYEADMTSEDEMKKIFDKHPGVSAIINIAGWGGVTQSFKSPRTYFWNNTNGVLNLLEIAKDYGVKKFIQASTSSEYGDNPIPWTEDMDRDKPWHPYAASKRASEILGYTYYKQYGIDFNATVFFNVYGPRQRPEMALAMLLKSHINKTPFPLYQDLDASGRDYTYVKDICEGVYLASKKELGYQVLNLGSSKPQTLRDFVEAVEAAVGDKIQLEKMPARPGEAEKTYADSSKAKELLGWEPQYTVKEGAKVYYDWFMNQPEWYKAGIYD